MVHAGNHKLALSSPACKGAARRGLRGVTRVVAGDLKRGEPKPAAIAAPRIQLRKASPAARTVAAMSSALCAALTKPASYSAGAR